MSARFEEIDRQSTPIGEISVRRRLEPTLQIDVYEVKLGDEFLMSSLFTVAEIALARLALAELPGRDLDVVVGGLGLGYTARAVLQDPRVRSLQVVEALGVVIDWHERDLLPLATELTSDSRCRLTRGDFFAIVAGGGGFGALGTSRCHAVLVDIDHSPRHVLHPSHEPFYEATGLRRLADGLHPGGVFALWADGAPDDDFLAALGEVFASRAAHIVTFANFYTGEDSASTVYIAKVEDG
jgi:spermidine synthase